LGAAEIVDRIKQRCSAVWTGPAGWSCLLEVTVPTDEYSGPRLTKNHPVDSRPAASPRARLVGKLLAAAGARLARMATAAGSIDCRWSTSPPGVGPAQSGAQARVATGSPRPLRSDL